MSHWIIVPILLPLLSGLILLFGARWSRPLTRLISLAGLLLMLAAEVYLLRVASSGDLALYALGN